MKAILRQRQYSFPGDAFPLRIFQDIKNVKSGGLCQDSKDTAALSKSLSSNVFACLCWITSCLAIPFELDQVNTFSRSGRGQAAARQLKPHSDGERPKKSAFFSPFSAANSVAGSPFSSSTAGPSAQQKESKPGETMGKSRPLVSHQLAYSSTKGNWPGLLTKQASSALW